MTQGNSPNVTQIQALPQPNAAPATAERDPVCGMAVDKAKSGDHGEHAGHAYSFRSAGLRSRFIAEPGKYLHGRRPLRSEPVAPGTVYACPVQAQSRQPGPGRCPICGMALEPEIPAAETGPNPELVDFTWRFWVGLALALTVFFLEMGGRITGMQLPGGPRIGKSVQFALATPVVLWAGWPFFVLGWQSLVNRSLNIFMLIALGTGVAWVFCVVATFAPGIFPSVFRAAGGSVAVYFEAASVIVVLVLLGQMRELLAREQTGGANRALLDLAPEITRRLPEDSPEAEVPLAAIVAGDCLRVHPEYKVPLAQVRSARGHRSSEWPTRSKAGSCRRLWRPPHLLSPRGRSGGQNHGSLTRWWRQ